jgi:hypothetical protein
LTIFARPPHLELWSQKTDNPKLDKILPGPLYVGNRGRRASESLVSTEEREFADALKISVPEYLVGPNRIVGIQLDSGATIDNFRINDGMTRRLVSRIWEFLAHRISITAE